MNKVDQKEGERVMRQLILGLCLCGACLAVRGQAVVGGQPSNGAMPSYNNEAQRSSLRIRQYEPQGDAFVSENGSNRFTRAPMAAGPTIA